MTTDTDSNKIEQPNKKANVRAAASASAPVYGLGLIGALVYYIQYADSFWMGVLGFFKAIFWPAMLVYEMLKFLKM
jgi:hypothetical protein